MKLIIGLGNPGKSYENTRHNAGFIVLDEIQKNWNFPTFQFNKKFNAEISEDLRDGEKIILAKPHTFMNQSGVSVKAILDFYKIPLEEISILHDDLDIGLGEFKISLDSSAGGHNGIISLIENLGTQKFKRVRIGIEGSEAKKTRVMSGSDFVLQKFSGEELAAVKELIEKITQNI